MADIPKKPNYQIQYSPETRDHFRALTAQDGKTVIKNVEAKLRHEPGTPTRNRKPLRPNEIAPWELRIGDLRVYYEIQADTTAAPVVLIKAVGIKYRNVLRIGGEVIEL